MKTKTTFTIGDSVLLSDPGQMYTTHYHAFRELGFRNPDEPKDFHPIEEKIGNIFTVISTYLSDGDSIVGIQDEDGLQLAVAAIGLTLVDMSVLKPLGFFYVAPKNFNEADYVARLARDHGWGHAYKFTSMDPEKFRRDPKLGFVDNGQSFMGHQGESHMYALTNCSTQDCEIPISSSSEWRRFVSVLKGEAKPYTVNSKCVIINNPESRLSKPIVPPAPLQIKKHVSPRTKSKITILHSLPILLKIESND